MPCYRPLEAYQCLDGAVVFSEGKGKHRYDIQRALLLACGQCVGCRLERSRQWAIRCTHEKQMHEEACFLTITYNDKHLPSGNTLQHEDIQKLLKRLRRHAARNLPKCKVKPAFSGKGFFAHRDKPPVDKDSPGQLTQVKTKGFSDFPKSKKNAIKLNLIRYYMCGEYGDKTNRAHYHMCLFGWSPKDQKYWSTSGSTIKSKIYTSATLDKIWGKGQIWIGEVTFESAAYVARYIMKKVNGQLAEKHYESVDPETGEIINRKPEYTRMSLKPGIGARWLQKYQTDVYPEGKVLARGWKSKSPKYYDKKFKKTNPLDWEDLLFERHKEEQKRPGENSKERLAVKETVARAKIAFLKRNAI